MAEKEPRFKVIPFSRNFGHQIAITAGMDPANPTVGVRAVQPMRLGMWA
jgi:hypothetical protein